MKENLSKIYTERMKLIHSMNAHLREIKHIAHMKQILSNF